MELQAVQGDALEFDFIIIDENGEEYTLEEGEKLFFMVGAHCVGDNCIMHIEQDNKHFQIGKIDLEPGLYDFDAGIIFVDGKVKTLIDADMGVLRIKRRAGER